MAYLGKYIIDSGQAKPVGSTLFGISETPPTTALKLVKTTTYLGANFTELLDGVTVHIQFKYGNTATSNLQLKIGDTVAKTITNPGGTWSWAAESILSFTYDGTNWVCNDGAVPAAGIVEDTYDPTSSNAISGKGVAEAIAPLVPGGNSAASYTVDTEIGNNPSSNKVPTSAAVANYVNNSFNENDAWIYKGTLGTGGTITTLPITGYSAGWVYRIITSGQYAGKTCEEGDFILAVNDASDSAFSVTPSHWYVLQGNITNPVSGPSSATQNNIAIFGANNQQIEDSGFTIQTSVPQNAVFTDTKYEDKGTISAVTGINVGNEFTIASTLNGRLHITAGIGLVKATASTGIKEVV